MYHYLENLQLYENSRLIRRFGYRCQSYVNNIYYDCLIELTDLSELLPSQSAKVQISFISIKLVAPLINRPLAKVRKICKIDIKLTDRK
jgi:hypothetical protein